MTSSSSLQSNCWTHGRHVSNNSHCDKGWSNTYWLSSCPSNDCDININAVVALSIILFVLSISTIILIVYYLRKRLATVYLHLIYTI